MAHLKEFLHSLGDWAKPAILTAIVALFAWTVLRIPRMFSWLRWFLWDKKVCQYMVEALNLARSEGKQTSGLVFLQSGIATGMKRSEASIVRSLKRLQKRGEVYGVLPPDLWRPNT